MSQLFGGYFDIDEYNNSTKQYHIKKIGYNENKDLISFLDQCNINIDIDDIDDIDIVDKPNKQTLKNLNTEEDSNYEDNINEDILLNKSILINDDDIVDDDILLDSSILISDEHKSKKNIIFDFNKDIIKRGKGIDKCTYDKKNKRIDGGKKEYSDGYSPYKYSLISDMISKKINLI